MTDRRRFLLGAAALLLAPTLPARAAEAPETGFYLFIIHPDLPHLADGYTKALAAPFVDGAAIMLKWSQIEPSPGRYDWATLDPWLRQVVTQNKKFSLGVIAGLFTPDWLYAPPYDVPRNEFHYNRSSVGTACTTMSQPSVWSEAYLSAYGRLMAALSQHVKDEKGAYAALTMVKLSGINNTTEELRIDTTRPDNGPCHQSDATAIWAEAGFTPQKVESAFLALATATERAFPDKILSMEIIHRDAFPALDAHGHPAPPSVPDAVTMRLIEAAIHKFGAKVSVQWDALWQGAPPREVTEVMSRGSRIGWQMNGFKGQQGGSGCIYPGFVIEECRSAEDFHAILDNGIGLGAKYLELQPASVNDPRWAEAFKRAHARLHGAAR